MSTKSYQYLLLPMSKLLSLRKSNTSKCTCHGIKTIFLTIVLVNAMGFVSQAQVEVFVNTRGTNEIKKYDENGNYMGNFADEFTQTSTPN